MTPFPQGDVLPPPPPNRSNDGCWKWGAIGCVGCGVLAVIGVIAIVIMVRPLVTKVIQGMDSVKIVARDMKQVGTAINKYHAEKGKYPEDLKVLIPHYLPDEKSLHPSTDAAGPEFTYTKPGKDSSSTMVMLEYDMPSPIPQDPAPWPIRMHKDLTIETLQMGNTSRTIDLNRL